MRQNTQGIRAFWRMGKPLWDVVATTCFWLYFTLGFVCIFAPLYLFKIFSPDRETAYQRLNSLFYRGFFKVVQVLTPGLTMRIDPAVYTLKSCVIVSNHLSYLDPLLFISIFEKHKTIVKHSFFHIPIFRSVIKATGYIPSSSQGDLKDLTLRQMEAMPDFLASGGNLFVFPEGTMRKNGITSFYKGAFSIARRCQVPLQVVYISNTHRLFPPGRFLFNTCVENTVSVELLGTIQPGTSEDKVSLSHLMAQVREVLSAREGTNQRSEIRSQRRLWRKTASLIKGETGGCPSPSLPGPYSSNTPGSDSPGNLGESHSICSGFSPARE